MSFIADALDSLGVTEFVLKGDPKNESEFNAKFKKVVGQDAAGTAILSDDPSGFGITWKEVSDQMKIEEQKFSDMEYARKRKDEYPDLAEQLDLLWHAIDAGTLDNRDHRNKFYSMLKKVKTDNPKG